MNGFSTAEVRRGSSHEPAVLKPLLVTVGIFCHRESREKEGFSLHLCSGEFALSFKGRIRLSRM